MSNYRPVLLRYVHSHHLQRFQTLDHPAMPLADPSRLHVQERVGHSAPQHRHNGLDIDSRWALRHWVPVLALKDGRREWHGILEVEGKEGK